MKDYGLDFARELQAVFSMTLEKHLEHTGRITYDDLDWGAAKNTGLTDEEVFILTYFSDIESQTILYMRDILNTEGVLDPEVYSFLTVWNYEEFYHGRALAKLLETCGHSLGEDRVAQVRRKALVSETLKRLGASLFSKGFPEEFIALYMTWGALNELTTLRGYEAIEATTKNPILVEICRRIAKQERRHFAWYFNSARERLGRSPRAQTTTRFILKHVWSPVGAGVKKEKDVTRLYNLLFPAKRGLEVAREIDSNIESLPGLEGLELMTRFAQEVCASFPTSNWVGANAHT